MKQKINYEDLCLTVLSSADIGDIMSIQEEAFASMEDTQTLRKNTAETFSVCFASPSITYGIRYQNKLIAFGMLYCAGLDKENLAREADYAEDKLNTVANLKVVIVLPDYRGNGIQKYLINHLENYAKSINIKTLMATVSPLNRYSLNNFEASGFIPLKTVVKYGGLTRVLLVKQL